MRLCAADPSTCKAKPRGRAPQGFKWDGSAGRWVDEFGIARVEPPAGTSRNKRRVHQRNQSEDQRARHKQKWQLYESGGRHYQRTHPDYAAALQASREKIEEDARRWKAHLAAVASGQPGEFTPGRSASNWGGSLDGPLMVHFPPRTGSPSASLRERSASPLSFVQLQAECNEQAHHVSLCDRAVAHWSAIRCSEDRRWTAFCYGDGEPPIQLQELHAAQAVFKFLRVAVHHDKQLLAEGQAAAVERCLYLGEGTVQSHLCLWDSRAQNLASFLATRVS